MRACRDCQRLLKHVPLMLIEILRLSGRVRKKKSYVVSSFIRNEVTFQRFKYRQDIIDCHFFDVTKGILLNLNNEFIYLYM